MKVNCKPRQAALIGLVIGLSFVGACQTKAQDPTNGAMGGLGNAISGSLDRAGNAVNDSPQSTAT